MYYLIEYNILYTNLKTEQPTKCVCVVLDTPLSSGQKASRR